MNLLININKQFLKQLNSSYFFYDKKNLKYIDILEKNNIYFEDNLIVNRLNLNKKIQDKIFLVGSNCKYKKSKILLKKLINKENTIFFKFIIKNNIIYLSEPYLFSNNNYSNNIAKINYKFNSSTIDNHIYMIDINNYSFIEKIKNL